jgi:hypothetical protein
MATADDTAAEFARVLRSTEFATIHDVAAVGDLREVLAEVQSALAEPETLASSDALPSRR